MNTNLEDSRIRRNYSAHISLGLCAALFVLILLLTTSEAATVRERHYPYATWQSLFTRWSRPEYPIAARRARMTGEGYYRLHVTHRGLITAVEVLKSTGHAILDSAAVAAMRTWHAVPGKRREIDINIDFVMVTRSSPAPRHHGPDVIVREFSD